MKNAVGNLLIVFLIVLNACANENDKKIKSNSTQTMQQEVNTEPNYHYKITPPKGWSVNDTTYNGLKVRLINAPDSLIMDNPIINILIASMENRVVDSFMTRNMNYLTKNGEGIILLEKGDINISTINARWFTYIKEQNGVKRDMINYIIPLKGFAYMITGGTNAGTMSKYRSTFDKIAKSFEG
jgi:hypothetical protein